ncbi:MAG: hypothetical protein JNJ58_10685 [Chitinophagaceae bacterium]|nr:hypothetical protein [Chitinophagaceae bacterium]
MSNPTLKKMLQPQGLSALVQTNEIETIVVEDMHMPHAGKGACKLCSCKQFVYGGGRRTEAITNHSFVACDNCGHEEKAHA